MKWTRSQLLNNSGHIDFDEELEITRDVFLGQVRIIGVDDLHIDGSGYLDDENDRFYCSLHVEGTMIVPDSITNQEIAIPFETESSETFAFGDTDEDGVRIVTDDVIDLLPAVIEDILLEVPLEVTELAVDEYPEGEGWKVYSEASYQESQKDRIDPRLAKLKEFKGE